MIILPHSGPLRGEVSLPPSKSESNRFLLLHALAASGPEPENLSEANDTTLMLALLHRIRKEKSGTLYAEDAGTVLRFLTPYLAAKPDTDFILTGTARLCERPMQPLIEALRALGADIECLENEGHAPLRIRGKSLQGGKVKIEAGTSSQFISALCLLAPTLPQGLHISLEGEAVSAPYIEWTREVLRRYGVETLRNAAGLSIAPQPIRPVPVRIEADWSAASFFLCMAMLAPEADLLLLDLRWPGIQADARLAEWAPHFGVELQQEERGLRVLKPVDKKMPTERRFDVRDCPDMAVPLITACALAYPMISFTGLQTLNLKESPRLQVLCDELKKAGCVLRMEEDVLRFEPRMVVSTAPVILKTFSDHRLAMSFAFPAMQGLSVTIDDAGCVRKSFPGYWEELRSLGVGAKE